MAPGSWQTEWRSRREPLSGYARVIRGERSAPNCVCVTPTLPGNCALRRRMKRETTSAHFPPRGIRRGSGGLHISFFCYYSFVSFDPCRPPPPASLSPLFQRAASSPADLKTGQTKHHAGKTMGHGVCRWGACMCLLRSGVSGETHQSQVFP